jgi:hypothetical protein
VCRGSGAQLAAQDRCGMGRQVRPGRGATGDQNRAVAPLGCVGFLNGLKLMTL